MRQSVMPAGNRPPPPWVIAVRHHQCQHRRSVRKHLHTTTTDAKHHHRISSLRRSPSSLCTARVIADRNSGNVQDCRWINKQKQSGVRHVRAGAELFQLCIMSFAKRTVSLGVQEQRRTSPRDCRLTIRCFMSTHVAETTQAFRLQALSL